MRYSFKVLLLSFLFIPFFLTKTFAQEEVLDTVKTGIYITSIHNIDFKENEYTINFWLWLKYKNKKFDFLQNLEIPQAKNVIKSFSTVDSSNNEVYILMQLQCIMKDSWQIGNFPFDNQRLRLSIENSQFDSKSLIFVADTLGKNFDPHFTLHGWTIKHFDISSDLKNYETAFGDPAVQKPHTEYSAFKVQLEIERNALGLFWKMFLGMYIAFLIAYVCCFIDYKNIDSRFGLSVGALFAVIGNKYIIDSSLPESITFTLVDTLHGITLFFILAVIASTVLSLKIVNLGKIKRAKKLDIILAQILLVVYLGLNIYFIAKASLT